MQLRSTSSTSTPTLNVSWVQAGMPYVLLTTCYVVQAELPSLYLAVDAFVLPSRGEGWGRPVMEAMAMGLPSIATNWSGTGEEALPSPALSPAPNYTHLRSHGLRFSFRTTLWHLLLASPSPIAFSFFHVRGNFVSAAFFARPIRTRRDPDVGAALGDRPSTADAAGVLPAGGGEGEGCAREGTCPCPLLAGTQCNVCHAY